MNEPGGSFCYSISGPVIRGSLNSKSIHVVGHTFYFSLKAQIKEAMELPEPVISRQEYDLKDNAIRSEIMNNRELIEKNFEKLELIEQRVYELR